MNYDICIIGAGPACFGILDTLNKKAYQGKILVIDQGFRIEERTQKDIMHGFGGAGAYTDMKLMIDQETGGYLGRYLNNAKFPNKAWKYITKAKEFYIKNGAPSEPLSVNSDEEQVICEKYGMKFVPTEELIHCGTDKAIPICKNIWNNIQVFLDIDWKFINQVDKIKYNGITDKNKMYEIDLMSGDLLYCNKLIIATGRSNTLNLKNLEVEYDNNIVDLGVRAEINGGPTKFTGMEKWFKKFYHPKLEFITPTYGDKVRTFCTNPQGYVTIENYDNFKLVNGETYKNKKSNRTNFAILVSIPFTEPFKDGNEFARKIARTVCQLNDGKPIVQSYRDLKYGRRSTMGSIIHLDYACNIKDFCPGDLSIVMPYRYMKDIMEFVERLDKMFFGVAESMLIYGLEAKFYANRPKMDENFMAKPNLYFAGDCSGITRGIIQATAMGMYIGEKL